MKAVLLKASLLSLFVSAAFAYSPDFFPLQVGNQWVYRTGTGSQATFTTLRITGTEDRGGVKYAVAEGLGARTLLRQDEDGVLWANRDGHDVVWAKFATPAGGSYNTGFAICVDNATVTSRSAQLNVPAAALSDVLTVRYAPAGCADAGVQEEDFVPWIGLVRRVSTSFAGPVVMELVYSRTGGVTVLGRPEVAFSLSIDQSVVQPVAIGGTPSLEARLSLRSTAGTIDLDFPSGQRYDFAIRNAQGEVVYSWSAARLFPAVVGKETITDGGEVSWTEIIPVGTLNGSALPAGRYTLDGWLTTGGMKRYAASTGFEIAAP